MLIMLSQPSLVKIDPIDVCGTWAGFLSIYQCVLSLKMKYAFNFPAILAAGSSPSIRTSILGRWRVDWACHVGWGPRI